jgi:L-serine dehydratase
MYLLLLGPMLEEKYGTKDLLEVFAITAFVTGVFHSLIWGNAMLCGASGVVPAVLYAESILNNVPVAKIKEALAVGALVGNLVKTNGSISGAEVGCQGEVGVACAMAAASLTYIKGGSNREIEYSAEIGLEHHLGMTCDPIDGLVQIPCIERNAMAAMQAYNCANYAILTKGIHRITLDDAIEVMEQTGRDLREEYRETSKGGLAYSGRRK